MPQTQRSILLFSKTLLAGFAVAAVAQTPSATNLQTRPGDTRNAPQRADVLEEIQSLQRTDVGAEGLLAEYKNAGMAALAAGEPVPRAASTPPATISAQRLRHHPPKAALKAFAQGTTAVRKGQKTEATKYFTSAVRLDPLFVEARTELGALYARTGEVSNALEQFDRALELEPNSSMLHYNRSWALLSLGRAAEAESEARRALAINPQHVQAHTLLRLALTAEAR
jgi:Flp pilus assembly protein TadD